MNNLLDGLNPQQLEAVLICDKPLRIIAGAGSGKTKVITTKIAYLIQEINIPAWKILAVTFTNKASKEMKERVELITGEKQFKPFISTFHAFCSRVLREEFQAAGLEKNFLIIDSYDQQQIVKKIIKILGLNEDQDKKKIDRQVISRISRWKNELLSPEEVGDEAFTPIDRDAIRVYKIYQDHLKANNQVDFDDLQTLVHGVFNTNKDVLEKWRTRFDYVMVDEFQDTNELQFDLIKFLTKDKNNLTVVGDPDQTIYSWRGAQVDIILNFQKIYTNAVTVVLNQNYRSTQQILNMANEFIDHNNNREKKVIFTKNPNGPKVIVKEASTRYAEAKSVASEIQDLVKNEYNYNDIFILYRVNAWSQEFEKVFSNSKIPFQLIGGIKFRDRKVIKDAMALLKVIAVKDDLSMERILGFTPKVGDVTIGKVIAFANEMKIRIFDLIVHEDDSLIKSITKNLDELRETLIKAKIIADANNSLETLMKFLLGDSGYELRIKTINEDSDDIKNINAFYDQLRRFDKDFDPEQYNETNRLLAFLQEEALITTEDDTTHPNKVTLLTIHSAKGLENKIVFVVGLNKDIFPSRMSIGSISNLEEERRALYVALTRAQERLYISYVIGEFSYIIHDILVPSKFVGELNKELFDFESNIFVHSDGIITSTKGHINPFTGSTIKQVESNIKVGDLVSHMIFGDGIVVKQYDNQFQVAFNNPKFGSMSLPVDNPILRKK